MIDDPDEQETRRTRFETITGSTKMFELLPQSPKQRIEIDAVRPELATEAIHDHPRLVLLGEPGSGKSTVLRHLALLLAQWLRGEAVTITGWAGNDPPIPILCSLGLVAAALPDCGDDAMQALWQVLGDRLEGAQGLRQGLRDYLKPALRSGGVLLLFDGLDELPDGEDSPRQKISTALRQLAADSPAAHMIVTCRVLPYQSPGAWQLPTDEGWQIRTIQPLTFGQVRQFVERWYHELAEYDPSLTLGEAEQRSAVLLNVIEQNERVQPMLRSPLLLTMLAVLHANTNEVPRDRVRLYEECVQLLLQRWDTVRTPGMQRPGLLERLGNIPHLEINLLRGVIHDLALQAHAQPPGNDGRGLLDGAALEGHMLRFFRKLRCENPAMKVEVFLQTLHEDSGLLQVQADDRYTLPHLTFQEYLAACALADKSDMVEQAYTYWTGSDTERWREVLLLLAGRLRLQGQRTVERDGIPWLKRLTARRIGRQKKRDLQRRRDAALAALSYVELGERAALANSLLDVEDDVEAPLRAAIVDVLRQHDPEVAQPDRIAAAQVLGNLDDPRFPVSLDEWRDALEQRPMRSSRKTLGTADDIPYLCVVQSGTYRIGGWKPERPGADITLPIYWMIRFPITVAQYAPFVQVGYNDSSQHWWTMQGWNWRLNQQHTQPWGWGTAPHNGANQPVTGVSWYEAVAFAAWLTEHMGDALPEGYLVRLPTEAEWEVAAAYDTSSQRHTYPWGEDKPAPEYAIYDGSGLDCPAPVGTCPAGAAACGALDMVGNVWEWATSSFLEYPEHQSKDFAPDDWDVPVRGAAWRDSGTALGCLARGVSQPDDGRSFRLVVAPALREHT
jgi:formylglycine-generating enzyme required for sulfatase activity